jgi:hypothetical protein
MGWIVRGDVIYAPNETIWFPVDGSWLTTLTSLREDMTSRLDRLQRNKQSIVRRTSEAQWQRAVHDTAEILKHLETIL